ETFFGQMRTAFSGYYCERYEIVSSGSLIGCRTEMGGTFDSPFDPTPFGTVQPHGGRVTLTLINMFRYDDDGKLAEEWVQYDNVDWLRQLGVTLTPAATK
ncbi:MAG: ester cyclase, partial [Mycobacterium sp.]